MKKLTYSWSRLDHNTWVYIHLIGLGVEHARISREQSRKMHTTSTVYWLVIRDSQINVLHYESLKKAKLAAEFAVQELDNRYKQCVGCIGLVKNQAKAAKG